jgi:hypothetical protein
LRHFQQAAQLLWDEVLPTHPTALEILRALREVWNARGDADVGKIDLVLPALMGRTKASRYLTALDQELRKLDR